MKKPVKWGRTSWKPNSRGQACILTKSTRRVVLVILTLSLVVPVAVLAAQGDPNGVPFRVEALEATVSALQAQVTALQTAIDQLTNQQNIRARQFTLVDQNGTPLAVLGSGNGGTGLVFFDPSGGEVSLVNVGYSLMDQNEVSFAGLRISSPPSSPAFQTIRTQLLVGVRRFSTGIDHFYKSALEMLSGPDRPNLILDFNPISDGWGLRMHALGKFAELTIHSGGYPRLLLVSSEAA